nr:hypothetical protein [Tanacetum cinerariifolium]
MVRNTTANGNQVIANVVREYTIPPEEGCSVCSELLSRTANGNQVIANVVREYTIPPEEGIEGHKALATDI